MYDQPAWMLLAQATAPETRPGVEPQAVAPIGGGGATMQAGPAAGNAAATGAAATGTSQPSSQPATQPESPRSLWQNMGSFLPIILFVVVLYFVLSRGQRKEEKRRKSLLAELKKGDRVMTIGGMVARVVSIDGDEVVLKIDESANVKATYRKSAIQEVLTDDKGK